jgi:outer membrane immunogenic protein
MRRIAAAAASILLIIGGTASAADLPPPVPPPYAPPPKWAGVYVGANVGGGVGMSQSSYSLAGGPTFASVDNALAGALGGGQVGYNWQFWRIVYGLEADFQGSSVRGGISAPCLPALCGSPALSASYSQDISWFGTVRGRAGFTAGGWLLYATGGYAYGRVDTNATAAAGATTASLSAHDNMNGWTVGSGIELEFTPHWSVKAEYLYVDLGRASHSWVLPGVATINDSAHVTENAIRAGVNYRF